MNTQTGTNIVNAVKVVRKTHENIKKLMVACQDLADGKQTPYLILTNANRFLRYNSDAYLYGWMYSSFVLIYKSKKEENVLYGMDINIDEGWGDGKHSYKHKIGDDVAVVCLAKYVYNDVKLLESSIKKISPGEWCKFIDPLYELDDKMDESDNEKPTDLEYVVCRIAKDDDIFKRKYMSLNRVFYTTVPLHEIDAETLKEKIFGAFDKLANL